ncbi:MAG: KUP/HAK/KT family potassium transporter, partial [Verrucomicrobiota bacterium]|nr:KUP/HAK/KT family potassium transporter [Verrucomicrobiota bacterium]
ATIARVLWKWSWLVIGLITAGFLVIDLAFFGANLLKFLDGGWFPLLVGSIVFTVMTTWKRGHDLLGQRLRAESMPLGEFLTSIGRKPPVRVPGTSAFVTGHETDTPPVLRHHLKHNQALTETALLLRIETQPVPHVPADERLECEKLRHGFYRITLNFGFMDEPNVAAALKNLKFQDAEIEGEVVTYYIGRGHVLPRKKRSGMVRWRAALFAFLFRNATQPVEFFNIPTNRVVELGIEVEI